MDFPGGSDRKASACNPGRPGFHLRVAKIALEKETATHFNILAWRIPWTEAPGALQPIESQRVGHNRKRTAIAFRRGGTEGRGRTHLCGPIREGPRPWRRSSGDREAAPLGRVRTSHCASQAAPAEPSTGLGGGGKTAARRRGAEQARASRHAARDAGLPAVGGAGVGGGRKQAAPASGSSACTSWGPLAGLWSLPVGGAGGISSLKGRPGRIPSSPNVSGVPSPLFRRRLPPREVEPVAGPGP